MSDKITPEIMERLKDYATKEVQGEVISIPLKTTATDLRDVMEFWEMKEDIAFYLRSFQSDCELYQGTEGLVSDIEKLVSKIESLGKKDGES